MTEKVTEVERNPKDIAASKRAPLQLIPPSALVRMSIAFENGANKYGPYNWRDKKIEYMNYIGAALRHLEAAIDGEDNDPESGTLTLAHAMACLAILIDSIENNCVIDNRPKKGNARELLTEIANRG